MVGSINYPTVESLAKKLHELSMKQSAAEVSKAATPSSQTATIFAQSSQKRNQQPSGKKKKGKKGEGNQNKQKPTNNTYGGKKIRKRLSFLISCARETT